MYLNQVLPTNEMTSKCLKHYSLSGDGVKTQCFFDHQNKLTDITWAGVMIKKGWPYWSELKSLLMSSMIKSHKGLTDPDKKSERSCIKSMHDLAERYC